MHFTVEIARFAGYPSRHVHQIASAIIARAIRTFSARGIDPQRYSSLLWPWFLLSFAYPHLYCSLDSVTIQLSLPISALPEDEWFVETAKSAINKLLLGASGSEASDIDEEDHIIVHDEVVSDSDTVSSLSTMESTESFASASMAELDSPSNLSDQDNWILLLALIVGWNFEKAVLVPNYQFAIWKLWLMVLASGKHQMCCKTCSKTWLGDGWIPLIWIRTLWAGGW